MSPSISFGDHSDAIVEAPSFHVFSDVYGDMFSRGHQDHHGGRLKFLREKLHSLQVPLKSAYDALASFPIDSPIGLSIMQARKRVWVLDPHFARPDRYSWNAGLIAVAIGLMSNDVGLDVRVLSESKPDGRHVELLWAASHLSRTTRPRASTARWRLYRGGLFHDRFCVVDDVLWHFGATVGGFHATVNACSTGWCASKFGFIHYFEAIWLECSGDESQVPEKRQNEIREELL